MTAQPPDNQPYGQPPYGRPAYGPAPYPPPPPPPRKTVIWPWILIGGLVLLCGGCFGLVGIAGNSANKTSTAAPSPEAAEQQAATTPSGPRGPVVATAGAEVRDGTFAFVITGIDAPVATLGDNRFLRQTAQGEYVVVHADVTNIGTTPQSYFGSNQKLIDDRGRRYTNDTVAEIDINDRGVIGAEINPGNKISVAIAFDVSPGTVPATIEFHDSIFSGGARVAVR
ncbi:DUF4352 domain-containing protein [Nocardia spumae]|uniref:DUF4352 domain-containing protein n=1 Tax=Nocardia spumae TaxID=2887190 RepID=UPI001D14E63C|nr:DUF4352 domain-containing protein [Nocardia spumae]